MLTLAIIICQCNATLQDTVRLSLAAPEEIYASIEASEVGGRWMDGGKDEWMDGRMGG